MRPILLVLAFALLAAPAVADTPETATASLADAQVVSEDLPAPAEGVDLDEACSVPAAEDAAASFCPFGGPDCVEHDDCDEFCGSPEFGYCDKQGFFPTGCCLCLG